MSKRFTKWGLVLLIGLVAIGWGIPFAINLKANQDIKSIERMSDTRDPQTISGSVWTSKLDCTYKNPPKYLKLATPGLTCEEVTHNLTVLRDRRFYFVSRSTAKDEVPYCLVSNSASSDSVAIARSRVSMYCHDSPIRKILSLSGVL